MKNHRRIPALMLVVITAKLVGMLRNVVLANYFGTSNISDAYIIASTVPTLLFYFIGHAITTSYLPIFNRVRVAGGEKQALRYTNNLTCVVMILCAILTAFVLVFPRLLVKLFASGFDEQTAELAQRFIRISSPSLFGMSLVSLFTGYLHAHESFLPPAAVSLPRSVFIIVSIVLADRYGLDWLGWGLIIAYLGEVLLLLPFVLQKGYRFRPVLQLRDPDLEKTVKMILPLLLGLSVSQINKIIDRSLASTMVDGGVSALSYASIINVAIQEILVTSIITIMFANWSELVSKGKDREVRENLSKSVNLVTTVMIPACSGLILLAEPIITVVLARGRFDENSTRMTVSAFQFYSVGLLFLAVRDLIIKAFYAYKDTKTTTTTSIIAILINIGLNLLLSRLIGLNGLAIATSISAIFHCLILYFRLRKKIGDYGTKQSLFNACKVLIGSGIMIAALILIGKLWASKMHPLPYLAVSAVLGVVIYTVVELALKNQSLKRFRQKEINDGAE